MTSDTTWADPDGAPETDAPEALAPEDTAVQLFDDDRGELPYELRRLLVMVLKKGYLGADANPNEWRLLCENQDLVESRLNDLFLHLVLDRDYQVAFKQQAVTDSASSSTVAGFPTLLHDLTRTREETVLLVVLRELFHAAHGSTLEPVFVDREQLLSEVEMFRAPGQTNLAGNDRATALAVERLRKDAILIATEDPQRFRIHPVIEVLLPVQRLRALTAWLHANTPGAAHTSDAEDTTTGPDEVSLVEDHTTVGSM